MLLKSERIDITIDGIVIQSHKIPGRTSQYMIDSTGIVGWYDGVETRRDMTGRPIGDGDFKEPSRKGSRTISITGLAEAPSARELNRMRDRFTAILYNGGYSEISVKDSTGIRYAQVGLSGTPSWIPQTDTFATWKLDLYAPSPEKYGPEKIAYLPGMILRGGLNYPIRYPLSFSAPVQLQASFVDNLGNTTSWPSFVVRGDYFAGFAINNGLGSSVIYAGPVTSSAPVRINMAEGSAIQNGVDKSYNLRDRDWFGIAPGSTIQPQFIPLDAGSGWCDIIYRDTWI